MKLDEDIDATAGQAISLSANEEPTVFSVDTEPMYRLEMLVLVEPVMTNPATSAPLFCLSSSGIRDDWPTACPSLRTPSM